MKKVIAIAFLITVFLIFGVNNSIAQTQNVCTCQWVQPPVGQGSCVRSDTCISPNIPTECTGSWGSCDPCVCATPTPIPTATNTPTPSPGPSPTPLPTWIPGLPACCSQTQNCPLGYGFTCDLSQTRPPCQGTAAPYVCVTPTPTPNPSSGLVCCTNNEDCTNQQGPGWECTDFAVGCTETYPNAPNRCVRSVIPTPVPGSGCNYTECRYDTDCDQASDCTCTGYIPGIMRGQCMPPFCGDWLHPCCEGDRCNEGLVPHHITIEPSVPIILCACIHDISLNFNLPQPDPDERMKCTPEGQPDDSGIDTAIGCIPIQNFSRSRGFIYTVLQLSLGISGGVAFILIVVSGFLIITSSGDPRRLQAGKELLTAAVSGIIFLVMSVFILRTIGVEIIRLPGL